ncbi:unnamed protein product [Sphacelaria rigidula]
MRCCDGVYGGTVRSDLGGGCQRFLFRQRHCRLIYARTGLESSTGICSTVESCNKLFTLCIGRRFFRTVDAQSSARHITALAVISPHHVTDSTLLTLLTAT